MLPNCPKLDSGFQEAMADATGLTAVAVAASTLYMGMYFMSLGLDACLESSWRRVQLVSVTPWLAGGPPATFVPARVPAYGRSEDPVKAKQLTASRWLAAHPGKRFTELFFLAYSPLWIGAMAAIVATGAYEVRGPCSVALVCTVLSCVPASRR